MKTVTLNRYAARENNGSVVKGEFVGGELYRYDADGYVLCREDIDEQGNVVNNLDRKALYDSAGRLVEEQFFRDGNMYRNIAYRGNAGIIEDSMSSDGIRVQTVKRMGNFCEWATYMTMATERLSLCMIGTVMRQATACCTIKLRPNMSSARSDICWKASNSGS